MSYQLLSTTTPPEARYSNVDSQKLAGSTYTPPVFATFLAKKILETVSLPKRGTIRVLDPAVGDGALLNALLECLPANTRKRIEVWGYDTDLQAIFSATAMLEAKFPTSIFHIEEMDFLQHVLNLSNQEKFHIVIANPPYVRTQVLGATQAQELAQSFDLTGRVDLYHPFLLGISRVLADDGVAGVITSNRFMTTKSGQMVRRALLSNFDILHVWDLGDTKLFDAAVLPSVLLAKSKSSRKKHDTSISFSTIYETKDSAQAKSTDALSALDFQDNTVIEISDGRCFRVRHGTLDNDNDKEGVWRVATLATDTWLATVNKNTWDVFRRVGKIRVGVKSTADKVFIRNDWDEISTGRPELLRPLITRHHARRFRSAEPIKAKNIKEILYPHAIINGRRSSVDLSLYPHSKKYLEQHKNTLEARTYVIEAGRNWFELWVPQDPAAWQLPKLVFPDISDKPIFWLDTDGGVVNGECYWMICENSNEGDLLWLALAIANSEFIEKFYDHKFNNKLYAGRRRFITQYVEQFPLPDPSRKETQIIIGLAKEIHTKTPSKEADALAIKLNELVWNVFGLGEEVSR
jgi:adenine-specific DNA-methyltransferase